MTSESHQTPIPIRQLPACDRQYQTLDNPKVSILELMWMTALIAGSIAAILQLGLVGGLILFTIIASASVVLRSKSNNPTQLRFWNQFLWGMLMPICCVFADPFVLGIFENGNAQRFQPYAFACYALMIWQVGWMFASWFVTAKHYRLNGMLAGTFLAGAFFALLVATAIAPFTIVGLIMLIGVLGLTPLFTAVVYYRTGMMHLRRARQMSGPIPRALVAIGFLSSLGILIGVLFLTWLGLFPACRF